MSEKSGWPSAEDERQTACKAACPELRRAILRAQRAAGTIHKSRTAEIKGKDGRVKYAYTFAGGEDVVGHGLAALHAEGVSWEVAGWEPFRGPGGEWLRLLVDLFHDESGELERREYPMPVAGFGDADKVTAGTITYCKGYAMAALLGIVRTDDKSVTKPDERRREVGEERPQYRTGPTPSEQYAALRQEVGSLCIEADDHVRAMRYAGVPDGERPDLGQLRAMRRFLRSSRDDGQTDYFEETTEH